MTDDHNDRPGVNLEELERQLRVASRAHSDANSVRYPQSTSDPKPLPIPDIEALRRDFTRSREADRPTIGFRAEPDVEPGPPPAFLSQSTGYQKNPHPNTFDDRFPVIDRKGKKGSAVFRALFSGSIALLMLGLGYSYFAGKFSGSGAGLVDPKSVPVIKADPNPVKIVPETNAGDEVAPSGSELFGKKSTDIAPIPSTKTSSEAPVDINAAVKNATPKTAPLVPGLGDPKTVRTVSVRPDGSVIGEQASPAPVQPSNAAPVVVTPPAVAMAQEQQALAVTAAPSPPAAPLNTAVAKLPIETMAALPTNLKDLPTIGGFPVPLPMPRPVDLGNGGQSAPGAADPLAALVAAATVEDPKAEGDNMALQPANPLSGDYTVQFGASPSEPEANALLARLKGQLVELLGGHTLAIVKGDSGGKTVFRVRALGYSRDEAAATCATAAAAGTKCFIAKN